MAVERILATDVADNHELLSFERTGVGINLRILLQQELIAAIDKGRLRLAQGDHAAVEIEHRPGITFLIGHIDRA